MDGNFTAEQMRMRRPENDVPIIPGSMFIVNPTLYEEHIRDAVDGTEVSHLTVRISNRLLNPSCSPIPATSIALFSDQMLAISTWP